MARRKRVVIFVAGNTHYGREAILGMIHYSMSVAQWEVHHESVAEPSVIARMRSAMTDLRPEGAIVQMVADEWRPIMTSGEFPVVVIGHHGSGTDEFASVKPHEEAIGAIVADYFVHKSLTNFAFCGAAGQEYSTVRGKGYCDKLKRAGFDAEVFELNLGSDIWMKASSEMDNWLRKLPKPVGIMTCDDYLGRYIICACRRLDIRVPDEVAVVGVDNDPVECGMSPTPLSSVVMPSRQLGFNAARLLDEMMSKPSRYKMRHILMPPVGIAMRRSSDILAVKDPDVAKVIKFVRDNAHKPITVTDILDAVHICRRSLERRFQMTLGQTLKQHVTDSHVELAKKLLTETDMKISMVGMKAGFTEHQAFARQFQELTGLLPSDYRRKFGGSWVSDESTSPLTAVWSGDAAAGTEAPAKHFTAETPEA